MNYLTWEQYSSLYSNVKEENFEALESVAEIKINSITHLQVYSFVQNYNPETATPFDKQRMAQIVHTTANLLNKIVEFDKNNVGSGIASVSNEGYSVSLNIINESGLQNELVSIVRNGLMGTGLLGVI